MSKKQYFEQAFLEDFDRAKLINSTWRCEPSALEIILEFRRLCWRNNSQFLTEDEVKIACAGRDFEPFVHLKVLSRTQFGYEVEHVRHRLGRRLGKISNLKSPNRLVETKRPRGLETERPRDHLKDSELSSKDSVPKKKEEKTSPWFDSTSNREFTDKIVETFREVTGAKYGFTGRDAKACVTLSELSRKSPEEVYSRWRIALKEDKFPKVRTLSELVAHWNHFAKPEPKPKPKAITFAEQIALTDAKFAAEKAEWEARQAAKAEVGT